MIVDGPVLITGASGRLARTLVLLTPPGVDTVGRTRLELDIADYDAVLAACNSIRPALIINGAAYNAVDLAEGAGIIDAFRVNAAGPATLAAACRRTGIPLVHFSTDLVFDGCKSQPYGEEDATHPLSVYGASKLAGEQVVLAADRRNWVIRVCRLFGAQEPTAVPVGNFPLLVMRLAEERGKVRVVDDQVGCPTYIPDLACAVWQLIGLTNGGLYHLCGTGEVTYADYAREVIRLAGVACDVDAVSTAIYGAPARRPLYSTLDNVKAHAAGVAPLRHWREALVDWLEQTASPASSTTLGLRPVSDESDRSG